MKYYSQYSQDEFLDENVFKGMRGGVFLEMGADDGITGSNTLFFERERGWSGLCIEPRPSAYAKLVRNRHCQTANVAISTGKSPTIKFLELSGDLGQVSGIADAFDPRHLERVLKEAKTKGASTNFIDVPAMTMNDALEKYSLHHIDYLSLDTEGGEFDILKSIDFRRFPIGCISVENNYNDTDILQFLSGKGYRKISRIKIDDIYVLRSSAFDLYNEPLGKQARLLFTNFKKNIKKLVLYMLDGPESAIAQKIQKNGFRNSARIFWRRLLTGITHIREIVQVRSYVTNRHHLKFNEKYIGRQKLVFDVGANMGNKVDSFLELGCRVVAIEPQSDYAGYLRVKYAGNPRVIVEQCGLGSSEGESIIHISSKYPGVSSLDDSWFQGTKYNSFDRSEKIKITRLDTLIAKYGLPYFCKIDVEGSEFGVLAGLSKKIPLLNFEFHSNDPAAIDACLEKLTRLGYDSFNFVLYENSKMSSVDWVSADKIVPKILQLEEREKEMVWGDVYAR